MKMRCLLVTR